MIRRTPSIPPRPDLQAPAPASTSRRRRPVAILLALALTIVPALALVVLAPRIEWETSRFDAVPAGEPSHDFLFVRADGSPIRWNPCQAIHYEVNLTDAPDGALALVEEAFRRTTEVTGVEFRFVGTTDRTLAEQDDSFLDTLSDAWEPLLVAWIPGPEFRDMFERPNTDRHALAVAYVTRGRTPETSDQYASGVIAVDADADMPPDFAGRYSLGLVLMHEAAHVMGLDHVKDPGEVMFADRDTYPHPLDDWGPGDREGLERLGEGRCEDRVLVAR